MSLTRRSSTSSLFSSLSSNNSSPSTPTSSFSVSLESSDLNPLDSSPNSDYDFLLSESSDAEYEKLPEFMQDPLIKTKIDTVLPLAFAELDLERLLAKKEQFDESMFYCDMAIETAMMTALTNPTSAEKMLIIIEETLKVLTELEKDFTILFSEIEKNNQQLEKFKATNDMLDYEISRMDDKKIHKMNFQPAITEIEKGKAIKAKEAMLKELNNVVNNNTKINKSVFSLFHTNKDVSDKEMAENTFGQSCNTAKARR